MTAAMVVVGEVALPMPKRPKRVRVPDQSWHGDAACREAGPSTAAGLQDVETQTEGEHLAVAWCARCPVARDCLETGVATHAWGVWGGVVLRDGLRAPARSVARRLEPAAAQELADQLSTFLAARGGWWAGTADQLVDLLGVDVAGGTTAGKVLARAVRLAGVGLVPLQRPPGNRSRRILLTAPDGPTVPTTTLAAEVYLALPALVAEHGGSWSGTTTELAAVFGTTAQHVQVALRSVAPMLAGRLVFNVVGARVAVTSVPAAAELAAASAVGGGQRGQPQRTTRARRATDSPTRSASGPGRS